MSEVKKKFLSTKKNGNIMKIDCHLMSFNQLRTSHQIETGQDKSDEGVELGREQRTIVLAERTDGRWEKWKRATLGI